MVSSNITPEYFKQYRQLLGFNNQNGAKAFFGAKDVLPNVDMDYIDNLNNRLTEIILKLDSIVPKTIQLNDEASFEDKYIYGAFEIIKSNNILPKLNNQGRRPEEVYFSWMRGFVIANYFMKALSSIFDTDLNNIVVIGDDDLKKIDTFKRTPTADLELNFDTVGKIRLEIQSGFQGINDIKQHKVLEAKKVFEKTNTITLVIHFDIYNGQVAIVRIDNIQETDANWITRQQMEGQTVLNIDQNHFVWKMTGELPNSDDIKQIILGND